MNAPVYGAEDRIFAQSMTQYALVVVGKSMLLQNLASKARKAGFHNVAEARDINELQCRFPTYEKGFVICELDEGLSDIRTQQLCGSAMDMARVAGFGFGIASASRIHLEGKLPFTESAKRRNSIDMVFLQTTETPTGFRYAMRLRFPTAHDHIHVSSSFTDDSLLLMKQVYGPAFFLSF